MKSMGNVLEILRQLGEGGAFEYFDYISAEN